MSQYVQAVYPVPDRFVNLGKESNPGSIAAGTYTFPLTSFKPVDKHTRLKDDAWRNAMAHLYNLIDGVRISDVSLGGPIFIDGIGYPLMSVLGDYWQGIAGGVTSVNTGLEVSSVIGAGTIVVVSASGISSGDIISIGGTATTACEVRKVTNVSSGSLTLSSALYQAHGSASASGTVYMWSSYQGVLHNFALLNNGLGGGGWTNSQPPTYTYEDFSGVPAVTGARQYGYACFSEVTITSDAQDLLMWDGKMTALCSEIAGSTPTVALTTVTPQAAWLPTVSIAGAGTINTASWKLTLTRKLAPKFANADQQDPIAIARGYFDASIAWDWDPASDEEEFLYYVNNTQPTVQIVAGNGQSGTAYAALTVTANQMGFTEGALEDSKDVFGFDETVELVANTTNVGPSGGFSPLQIQLQNQVIAY